MKKGFTIIEIIISIGLILIVGVSATVVISSNSKNNEIEKINNLFLDATNLFIRTEIDEDGDNYNESLQTTNSRGVKIPLTYLVEKGYVSEEDLIKLKELNNLNDDNYYVLALKGGNDSNNYCDEGETSVVLSWTINDKNPVYLCDKVVSYKKQNILDYAKQPTLYIDKYAVSSEYYLTLSDTTNFTDTNNSLFTYFDENTLKTYYYYRGAVTDNYLQLGEKDGQKLMWRIMWLNNENKMKLILDEEVPVTIENINGEKITVNQSSKVFYYKGTGYILYNPTKTIDKETESSSGKVTTYYSVLVQSDNQVSESSYNKLDALSNHSLINGIYMDNLTEWYNNTNLSNIEYLIKTNNFCWNRYTQSDKTVPTNVFDCSYDSANSSLNENTLYSSPVGFITYGEATRLGIIGNQTDIVASGNYLLKNANNAYPLVDFDYAYEYRKNSTGARDFEYYYYYINNNGRKSSYFFEEYRSEDSTYYRNYYRFVDENNNVLKNYERNFGSDEMIIREISFFANTVKPAIVIDMTNKSLNGSGTVSDPYIIN